MPIRVTPTEDYSTLPKEAQEKIATHLFNRTFNSLTDILEKGTEPEHKGAPYTSSIMFIESVNLKYAPVIPTKLPFNQIQIEAT